MRLSLAGLLAVTATLGACGFHLRGDVRYPPDMSVTYIEAGDRYSAFYRKLKTALKDGGVTVVTDPTRAGAVLRVLEDSTGERVVSVSARNTPTEYEVYYVISYALEFGGSQVLPRRQLSLSRNYNYDSTRVLGKASEAQVIRDALAADLVALVTRRLSAAQGPVD